MLILNKEDIWKTLSLHEVMDAIESALLIFNEGNYHMPDRMHAHSGDNTLLLMPCFTDQFFGTKLVSVNPKNQDRGEPSIYGTMILNDGVTGKPLALMDGAALTALRTGAVGGIGVKYTSSEDASSAGVIGTGVQGFTQALFTCRVRNINTLYVYDIQDKKVADFIDRLRPQLPDVNINACKSSNELVEKSQIIITTTTSTKPVIPDDPTLLEGKNFIGIGSYRPHMHELSKGLYPLLKEIYVDTPLAREETGDLLTPLQKRWIDPGQITPISTLITEGKKCDSSTTLFKSVGMALFDVVVAQQLYTKAQGMSIGTTVTI